MNIDIITHQILALNEYKKQLEQVKINSNKSAEIKVDFSKPFDFFA